ncbi:MAG TPA: pseudouridine-5'-phosphate glycosidase [Anaerolineales bacterium]|nr:pseudouridine-5'-phosphate glycosidase [Anaerolineales bacterium]
MQAVIHPSIHLSPEVAQARALGIPIVALESTVITHGLPYPDNLYLAQDVELDVRDQGAVPATIGVLDGVIQVGMELNQLERLASGRGLHKASPRDFSRLIVRGESGGTTVAGTIFVAHATGLRVFATGGIGGVHRGAASDVSADLLQLARTPLVVVCAGAKAILDLPATLEYLETQGVPVVGYQTDDFPAFYSRKSGLQTSARADSPEEVAEMARVHWALGMNSALLVTAPPPVEAAMEQESVQEAIEQALKDARREKVHGQAVTPFLLNRVSELTGRESLAANLGLLRNNARLAGQFASSLARGSKLR